LGEVQLEDKCRNDRKGSCNDGDFGHKESFQCPYQSFAKAKIGCHHESPHDYVVLREPVPCDVWLSSMFLTGLVPADAKTMKAEADYSRRDD